MAELAEALGEVEAEVGVAAEPAESGPDSESEALAPEETANDDAGEPEAEADPDPDPAPAKEPEKVPLPALMEERRKRQELEARLAALEKAGPTPEPAESTSLEDEYFADPVNYTQTAIQREVSQRVFAMSEYRAQKAHADYQDVVAVFIDAANSNPALVAQMNAHPDPAEFAYEMGKTYSETQNYGSVEEMRAEIAKQEREKILKEFENQKRSKAASGPKSLAGVRGSGAPVAGEIDDSLEALLG